MFNASPSGRQRRDFLLLRFVVEFDMTSPNGSNLDTFYHIKKVLEMGEMQHLFDRLYRADTKQLVSLVALLVFYPGNVFYPFLADPLFDVGAELNEGITHLETVVLFEKRAFFRNDPTFENSGIEYVRHFFGKETARSGKSVEINTK